MNNLVALPVALPLLGAGLCLVLGRSARAQRLVSIAVLSLSVLLAAVLLYQADTRGPQILHVGGWEMPMGITLVADRLAALLLLISTLVTLCVLLYSLGQGVAELGRQTPLSVFHPTFLILCAGVSNAFLSGDLFNLFVSFEILLVSSYVLITLGGSAPRVRSGTTYVVVSLVSSVIFLAGLALMYAATGTVNMADLGPRLTELPDGVALMLQLVLLTAFAVKAAVFPLSAWLPDSYPTAPAPVTAVFAGLLTKVGVYAIIRVQTLLFPEQPLTDLFLVAATLTMLVAALGAIVQSDIKRVLSFTLVSHIGYMLLGVALASPLGVAGAVFYTIHHIVVQTSLFLLAGLIELRAGTTQLDRLGGLARTAPLLAVTFFVPAMNLSGIPPMSGFLGKVPLVQAGLATGTPLALVTVAAAIVASLLTLYALARVWNRAFWQPAPQELPEERDRLVPVGAATEEDTMGALYGHGPRAHPRARTGAAPARPARRWEGLTSLAARERLPLGLALPTLALVVLGLSLTFLAGPVLDLSLRTAEELLDPAAYIDVVLGRST
ncbi:Na+/H+ antiporter subunit D [Actinomycetota bacterium]